MNVGPTDLARIVAPFVGPSRGNIVTVLRRYVPGEIINGEEFCGDDPAWVCLGFVRYYDLSWRLRTLGPQCAIADRCLRRIDPPPGEVFVWDGLEIREPA